MGDFSDFTPQNTPELEGYGEYGGGLDFKIYLLLPPPPPPPKEHYHLKRSKIRGQFQGAKRCKIKGVMRAMRSRFV